MKFYSILGCLLSLSLLASAQQKQLQFPEDFLGVYKGTLEITSTKGQQEIDMEFHLLTTPTPGNYAYTLVYIADGKRQERHYSLIEKNKNKGQYMIDEHNGIFLNASVFGTTLYSVFEVSGNLLTTTETFYENAMDFEITMASKNQLLESKSTDDTATKVISYPVLTKQRAHLLKE
ncbi:MAG: hypothetical protein ACPGU9_08385 [Flavobacteriaceae bacterium]